MEIKIQKINPSLNSIYKMNSYKMTFEKRYQWHEAVSKWNGFVRYS